MKRLLPTLLSLAALASARADSSAVANGINSFGLDLHRRLAAGGGNLVTSPWSISSALTMTYGGAVGRTKEEMQRVLHLGKEDAAVHDGFAALSADLTALALKSQEQIQARSLPTPSSHDPRTRPQRRLPKANSYQKLVPYGINSQTIVKRRGL